MAEVNTPTTEYERVAAMWKLPRTLMGGTKAMRKAGHVLLPQEPNETDTAYRARLHRSVLFNAFRKTVRDMTGKVFSKPVALGDDVPADIKTFAENIDFTGRHLNVFARDVFFDSLQTGIGFILTEMPTPLTEGTGRAGEVTKADDTAANRRPYLCFIQAEDVIECRGELVNGIMTLTRVRIMETVTIPDGEFGEVTVVQVRVLKPGLWEIWREITEGADAGKWMRVEEGTTTLTRIPLAPVYINRTGFMIGEPPLEDLADLNVAHWQSQSDQKHILHFARVPILFAAGFTDDAVITIGANSMIRSSDPAANVSVVEHSGGAIGSGDKDIANIEFQMQTQGLQLLVSQPGDKTATGEIHDDIKENSSLAMMATALGDAIEQSFGFMAEYLGKGQDAGGSVTVNTDFGIAAGAVADIPNIIAAANAGLIDKETAIDELKRRNFLADSVQADVVLSRIETEKPELDGPPLPLDQGAAA